MNKKNLSVVLAGAMLATSVAPVLADTTTAKEYSLDDIKLLSNEIVSTMKKEMLTTNSVLKGDGNSANDFLSEKVVKKLGKDESAYGIRILDAKGNKVDLHNIDSTNFNEADTFITYNIDKVEKIFNTPANVEKLKSGYTIELVKRATNEFYGELIPGTAPRKKTSTEKYDTATDFIKAAIDPSGATYNEIVVEASSSDNVLIEKLEADKPDATATKLTVTTNKLKNPANAKDGKVSITLTKDSDKIDGRLPLTADNKLIDYKDTSAVQNFDHFETLVTWEASSEIETAPVLKSTYKLTPVAEDKNAVKASELYDGMLLKAKGTELLSDLTNAAEALGVTVKDVTDAIAANTDKADEALVKLSNVTNFGVSDSHPVYEFEINYYKNAKEAKANNPAEKTVTVHSTNKDEISALYKLLKSGDFSVGIVGGANRYETAVNVAKANNTTVSAKGNIVLVNGDSLVDGLSAAPLASDKNAPVLLTKADKLSEATKEYIKSLTNGLTTAEKKSITINLVGGESVLKDSLVKELEDMGFYVERFGGDNRESTSIAVAEEIAANGNKNAAFVVGGNGEADAMAISAVAAGRKTPIIVSSVNGLSADALGYLKENSAKGDVTIVGGESVVSADEEKSINESLSLNKVERIAGANRFETNAKIIEKYYKQLGTVTTDATGNEGVEAVVVVKDGQSSKGELVDALAAANYAAQKNAPIVLATKSLNASQKNALLKVDTEKYTKALANSMEKAVQVGEGAERSVIETVAGLFNLKNN